MNVSRRSGVGRLLAVMLLVAGLATAAARAQVFNQVPDDALVVVKVKNLQATSDKVGKLFRDLPPGRAARLSDVSKRSGLRAAEIRAMAGLGAITIVTRGGDQWLEPDDAQVVELWGEVRRAGYTSEIGFPVENLRLYVEAVRWLAREELRLFTAGVTGRVEAPTAVRMAEAGIARMNEIIALLRKATLLRYIGQGNLPRALPDEPAVGGKRRGPSNSA